MKNSVPLTARIGFGVGDLSFNLVWQGTSLFLLYFYTDILGIAPAIAGTIYLAAMIWDAVTDPLIATLADRTYTPMGKYRPWLLYGAVPFALSYPLAFSAPPSFLPFGIVAWALITHIILRTTFTTVSMPFNSLQARLTNDAQERTVLAGFRMVGAATGALAVAFLTPLLVRSYSDNREMEAYFVAACIIGIIALAALLYCFFSMREPSDAPAVDTPGLLSDLKSIGPLFIKNPPLIRMFAIIIIASVCLGMFSGCLLYYFKYHRGQPDQVVYGLGLLTLMLILAVPFWVWLSGKTSKRTSMAAGLCVAFAGYVTFFINPADDLFIALFAIGLTGLGSSALAVMFWAMLPDTIEYGEATTGIRAEAKTFGFATFAQKAAVGINAVLLGVLLEISGFEPNATQTETTLIGMKAIMALIPALGAIAILLILRGYKLNHQLHAEMVAKIAKTKQSEAHLKAERKLS